MDQDSGACFNIWVDQSGLVCSYPNHLKLNCIIFFTQMDTFFQHKNMGEND